MKARVAIVLLGLVVLPAVAFAVGSSGPRHAAVDPPPLTEQHAQLVAAARSAAPHPQAPRRPHPGRLVYLLDPSPVEADERGSATRSSASPAIGAAVSITLTL